MTYRAAVDQPQRFVHSRAVGASAGLTPKRCQSGEIDYDGGISKCGDLMLRTMLYEAAQSLLVHSGRWSWLKAWGIRVAQRRGMRRAIVAVARRLRPQTSSASSASAGRGPHGDDGWSEFVMSAAPAANNGKDAP